MKSFEKKIAAWEVIGTKEIDRTWSYLLASQILQGKYPQLEVVADYPWPEKASEHVWPLDFEDNDWPHLYIVPANGVEIDRSSFSEITHKLEQVLWYSLEGWCQPELEAWDEIELTEKYLIQKNIERDGTDTISGVIEKVHWWTSKLVRINLNGFVTSVQATDIVKISTKKYVQSLLDDLLS